MKVTKKFFTLIELIVVIVILGILAAIVIPNISSFKEEARETALSANEKNFQTAVDMYIMKNNGKTPTLNKPTLGEPQVLQYQLLSPEYIRKKSNIDFYVWLDENNEVMASYSDAPNKVIKNGDTLSWEGNKEASGYQLFGYNDSTVKSTANKDGLSFIKNVEVSGNNDFSIDVSMYPYEKFLVTSVDTFENESPLVKENATYTGYVDPNPSGKEQDGKVEVDNYVVGKGSILFKDEWAKLIDNNPTTTLNFTGNTTFDFDGDVTNRTIEILGYSTGYWSGNFVFKDANGNTLESVDGFNERIATLQSLPKNTANYLRLKAPVGATQLELQVRQSQGGAVIVNEIKILETESIPLNNLTDTPESISILLDWVYPNPENYQKVMVFKDKKLLGSTSSQSLKDTPIYSDTPYSYVIVPVSKNGFVGKEYTVDSRTLERAINWQGLSPQSFDLDKVSFTSLTSSQIVRWEGDLKDRTIYVNAVDAGYWSGSIGFRDSNNNQIESYEMKSNVFSNLHPFTATSEFYLKVPENADHILITVKQSQGGSVSVKEIQEMEKSTIQVENLTISETDHSTIFTQGQFKSPSLSKVAIFRDKNYIGTMTENSSFTDTPLMSETEYDYMYYPVNQDNTIGTPYSVTKKTKARSTGIKFSGMLAQVFDYNLDTYQSISSAQTIRWSGNLEGRTIYVKAIDAGYWSGSIGFRDSSNNLIESYDANDNKLSTTHPFTGTSEFYLKVPENADHILITVKQSQGGSVSVYEIKELPLLEAEVKNVAFDSNDYSIEVKSGSFENSEVSRYSVFRDKVYKANIGENSSYTDTPLMSETSHIYTIYPVSNDKRIGTPYEISEGTTLRASGIKFSGMLAEVFDHNTNTYQSINSAQTVRWTGDLEGKTIYVKGFKYGYWRGSVGFRDANNIDIPSLDLKTGVTATTHAFTNTSDFLLTVPENADHIYIPVRQSQGGSVSVYEIEER